MSSKVSTQSLIEKPEDEIPRFQEAIEECKE